jgi:cytochrome P450
MNEYFMPLLEERRRAPRDDMLTAMIDAVNQGDALKPKELLWNAVLLLTGSYLAILVAMSNCIFGLARYPDQFERLRQNPALVDSAVEELLRFESQVQLSGRRALEDIELHGQLIGREQTVILSLGSANRDETVFPNPDSPDLGRPENKHIAFGYNPHTCVARQLARLFMRTVIGTLAKRFKTLRIDAQTINWNGAPMFRSFEALPVAVTS